METYERKETKKGKCALTLPLYLQALLSNSSLALIEHRIREVLIRRHNERFFCFLLSPMIFLTPLKLKVRVLDGVLGVLMSIESSSISKGFPGIPGGFGVSAVGGSHSDSSRISSSWPLVLD